MHEKKQADKHHTALLLNCFVKQKQIDSLDKFLKKESKYDMELFDIETAIKVKLVLVIADIHNNFIFTKLKGLQRIW